MNNLILRTIAKRTFYLFLAFSLYLLFRGHNLPGGGFIAGLLTVAAIVLQYLAFDLKYVQKLLPIDYINVAVMGLALATLTGIGGMFLGYPFLTQAFDYYTIPIFGTVELATALLFDIGVYLVVIGSVLTIISAIGDEKSWNS